MDYKNYGDNRFTVCLPEVLSEVTRTAAYELYGAVSGYLPYVLTVTDAGGIGEKDNIIYLGTEKSSPAVAAAIEGGVLKRPERAQGYSIKVCDSPRPGRVDIFLAGADDAGVLYAVDDFKNYYVKNVLRFRGYVYNGAKTPFVDGVVPYERFSSPTVENRGLWSWGHVIYDYRGYIDNMYRHKLNTLIVWNDNVPLNAKEVVEYAHARAVRVYFGYSCAWGEDVDPYEPGASAKWAARTLEIYRSQYKETGCDGVYFQAFTERAEKELGGRTIASLVRDWANDICRPLLGAYPGLDVIFGIHGTSIAENYADVGGIDPRVTVMWEDCGAFPYAYDPRKTAAFDETLDYTKSLIGLAQRNGGSFAALFKGLCVLKWPDFEHQKGQIIMGESDKAFREKRRTEKTFYHDFCAPYFINGAGMLSRVLGEISGAQLNRRTVLALIEDGMWEEGSFTAADILCEYLFDAHADPGGVIEMVLHAKA